MDEISDSEEEEEPYPNWLLGIEADEDGNPAPVPVKGYMLKLLEEEPVAKKPTAKKVSTKSSKKSK